MQNITANQIEVTELRRGRIGTGEQRIGTTIRGLVARVCKRPNTFAGAARLVGMRYALMTRERSAAVKRAASPLAHQPSYRSVERSIQHTHYPTRKSIRQHHHDSA